MKVRVSSEQLQRHLSSVMHAVSARHQLPVLGNLLLEAEGKRMKIVATDLEIGIEIDMQADIEEKGGTTVPAKVFHELINAITSETISLQATNGSLTVKAKNIRGTLQTIAKEEFPKLYDDKGKEVLTLTEEEMQRNFPHVVFAASTDVGRPALSGVLVKIDRKEMVLVATDGYRLSLRQFPHQGDDEEVRQLIVPARVIREVLLLKQEGKMTLSVLEKNNQALFLGEGVTIVGRLIDAQFPEFQKIIPTHFETKALFDRESMQKAVKTCSIFAKDAAHIVRLSLQKRMITVSASSPSVGETTVEVEGKTEGEENEIAFNARYLLDLFANVGDEQMTFEMTGPLNPGVFKIVGDESYLHLIMPIRVQS